MIPRKIFFSTSLSLLLLSACCKPMLPDDPDKSKKEILQAEQDFEAMVKEKGLADAFAFFADSAAVVKNGKSLVKGRDAIFAFYKAESPARFSLTWDAEFADASGNLGYTYGTYIWTAYDSLGTARSDTGIFHTVWKKQKDGKWKFVWD